MSYQKGFTPKRANSIRLIQELISIGHIINGQTRLESGWGSYTILKLRYENGHPTVVELLDKNGELVLANNSFLNTRSFHTAPPLEKSNKEKHEFLLRNLQSGEW